MLVRLIARLVRRYRPARLVFGVTDCDTPAARSLRVIAARAARRLGVQALSRSVSAALSRLGFIARRGSPNGLAKHLAEHFVPMLRREVATVLDRFWHRRPAWHALAVALLELVEIDPFAAAALVPASGHAIPPFSTALRRALPTV